MNIAAEVAVDNAAFKFDKLYSYKIPAELREFAAVGSRVLVPFGKAAPRMGVILGLSESDSPEFKSIIDIERGHPALSNDMVRLITLLREKTFCTYYDAVRTILPKNSRLVPNEDREKLQATSRGHIETVFSYTPHDPRPRLTEKQRAVCALIENNPMTAAQIIAAAGVSRGVIDNLAQKDIIQRSERAKDLDVYAVDGNVGAMPDMTQLQQRAFNTMNDIMSDAGKPGTTLFHGVTSSGKTIVYIKLIDKIVNEGRGALVLVPEIVLATQMIYRLRELFGERVGIIHSALSDSERQIQWDKIRRGECSVVVGTRSAVFAPVQNLGIIIVDEEQETTYVSEQTPRYSALDVAAFRSKETGAHLVLSSATPSVESYYKAKNGAYNLVYLGERYGDMPLPKVRVVDMRRELLAGNSHYVSKYLKEEIDTRIERGEQCILLLNRRGYRPLSMCNKCKKIVKCESCDTPLVLHKTLGMYICHYCNKTLAISQTCDECGGGIKHTGIGTQKIEEDLEALFPAARILRLDVDSVSKKHSAAQLLFDFSRGKYDIIIGTQMIAKGLDFPNVTLVGVLSIDQLMLMPSYRAAERTFAMLTQVVGRSGRGDKKGEAVIQTVDPENAIIRLAAKQDYEKFYDSEIISRKAHLYPPFCAISSAGFIAEKEPDAAGAAKEFAKIMQDVQQERFENLPIRILDPAPMRVSYIGNLFRYHVVIKHRPGREFRVFLRECVVQFNKTGHSKSAKIFVDFVGEPGN